VFHTQTCSRTQKATTIAARFDLLNAYYNECQDARPPASTATKKARAIENCSPKTIMRAGHFFLDNPHEDALYYSQRGNRVHSAARISCRNYAKPRRRMKPEYT